MLLKITITYCTVWHYTQRATGLVAELLNHFEPEIESLTLVPSQGGRFEVDVNEVLLYSKLHTGRHAQPGEIVERVKDYLMKRG